MTKESICDIFLKLILSKLSFKTLKNIKIMAHNIRLDPVYACRRIMK